MEKTCMNCAWGKELQILKPDGNGKNYIEMGIECHYYPAVVLPPIIATLDSFPINCIAEVMDHMRPLTVWPTTKPDDFCHKFASKEWRDNVPDDTI